MHALIDADIISYACAYKHKDSKNLNDISTYIDESIKSILTKVGTNEYIGFLTGKGNFRHEFAKTKSYKGTRSTRPIYLEVARAYMQAKYGFIVTDGIEADDAIAICAEDTNCVICSTDKDLDQIPGHHYNWVKGITYEITQDEALINTWLRMLTGDTVDNIQGIEGIGPVKAKKILSSPVKSNDEYRETVLNAFIQHYGLRQGISMFSEHYQLIALLNKSEASKYNFIIPKPLNISECGEYREERCVQEEKVDGAKLFE